MKHLKKVDNNEAEERFYEFLNDFELTSMIRKVESQVWIKTPNSTRRIDFVITLNNGEKIYIELDGATHHTPEGREYDAVKEYDLSLACVNIVRIRFSDFFENKETVANRLEGLIDLLTGDQ